MQTTIMKEVKKNQLVVELVDKLINADNKNRAIIENQIVNLGSTAIKTLVDELQSVNGQIRGIVAMALIRIGKESIYELQNMARQNKELAWISSYIISEINLTSNAA